MVNHGQDCAHEFKTNVIVDDMMTKFLLITANVGSIFHDPNGLLKSWTGEFLKTVESLKPQFIAIHFQEFGGKDFRKSQNCSDELVRILISSPEMLDFEHVRIFLDEDFLTEDKFTALGCFYFIHKTLDALIWNFDSESFVPATGKEIHSGSIDRVPIKFKKKFPQEFFPECKWSRKGFIRTRWRIIGFNFEMINIHLFHDESNFISIQEFPSTYAKNRRKALQYTLDSINKDDFNDLPIFIFGDLNFRLDTREVVQTLTKNLKMIPKTTKNGDLYRITYHDQVNNNDKILNIEKKQFCYKDQDFFLNSQNRDWLLKQDKELRYFDGILFEYEKQFSPSYPFEEKVDPTSTSPLLGSRYMSTRCPSWCDRVLMNAAAKRLLDANEANANHPNVHYDSMGFSVPMGDHKPVYLHFRLDLPPTQSSSELEINKINVPNDNADDLNPIKSCAKHLSSISTTCSNKLMPSVANASRSTIKKIFYTKQPATTMINSLSSSDFASTSKKLVAHHTTATDSIVIEMNVFQETTI